MTRTALDDLDSRPVQNGRFRTRVDASDGFRPAQPPFPSGKYGFESHPGHQYVRVAALGLRLSDIDFDSSQIAVVHADVPRIRLDDLLHTNATLSLKAGVHPKVVSERLGRSSVAITLDLYSHITPGTSRDAAATVEAMLFD